MDTDGSGTLTMSEFIGFWEGLRGALNNEAMYERLLQDCVMDFNITVREVPRCMPCLKHLDEHLAQNVDQKCYSMNYEILFSCNH